MRSNLLLSSPSSSKRRTSKRSTTPGDGSFKYRERRSASSPAVSPSESSSAFPRGSAASAFATRMTRLGANSDNERIIHHLGQGIVVQVVLRDAGFAFFWR